MQTAGGAAKLRPLSPARWKRNFLATWPSLFVVSLGLMAVLPTLPLYVEERYGIRDPDLLRRWSGLIYAAGPFAAAIAGPLWGALGDRIGRKAMVVRSSLAIGVCMAAMPWAPSPFWMVVMRLLQGVFAGYVAPAIALVAADVPPERAGRAISSLQVALASGTLFGPVLGELLATHVGRGGVFYVTAGLSIVAAVVVAFGVREDRSQLKPFDPDALWREVVRAPFRLLRSWPIASLVFLVFAMRLGQNMPEPYVALWVRELGPLPAFADSVDPVGRTTALAFTLLAVAQLVCTPLWGRLSDRFGPLRCLTVVSLALALVLGGTALVPSIEAYLGLRVLAAVFMAGSMTLAYASVTRRTPLAERATAFALAQSCIQFGLSLGPAVGDVVAVDHGMRGMFVVAGGVLAVTAVGMITLRMLVPPTDRLPTASPPTAPPPAVVGPGVS